TPAVPGLSRADCARRARARQTASPMSWLPMLATWTASRRASDPMPGAAAIRERMEKTPDLYPGLGREAPAPAIVPPVARTVIRGRKAAGSAALGRATGPTLARKAPAV